MTLRLGLFHLKTKSNAIVNKEIKALKKIGARNRKAIKFSKALEELELELKEFQDVEVKAIKEIEQTLEDETLLFLSTKSKQE